MVRKQKIMIPRLRTILDKCANKKFRNGYITYLKSLDYDEFEKTFNHYSTVIAKLLIKNKKNKVRIFSKIWFKIGNLEYKWEQLYKLFYMTNPYFVDLAFKNLNIKNNKRIELISKITEHRTTLNSIVSNLISLTQNPTQEEIIRFNLIIIDSIYTSEELEKLVEELNNMQQ